MVNTTLVNRKAIWNELKIAWDGVPGKKMLSWAGAVLLYLVELIIGVVGSGGKPPSLISIVEYISLPIILLVVYFSGALLLISLKNAAAARLRTVDLTSELDQARLDLAGSRQKEIAAGALTKKLENDLEEAKQSQRVPQKRKLTIGEVQVGNFQEPPGDRNSLFMADALAAIVLQEDAPPPIEIFLSRVRLGELYCLYCKVPLIIGKQLFATSFACPVCRRNKLGQKDIFLKLVRASIRRDFMTYWAVYRSEISKLTNDNPLNFEL